MAPDAPANSSPSPLWGVGIVSIALLTAGGLFAFGLFSPKAQPWVEVPQSIHDTSEPLIVQSEHDQWEAWLGKTSIPIQKSPTDEGFMLTIDLSAHGKTYHQTLQLKSKKDTKHIVSVPIKGPVPSKYAKAATLVRVPARAFKSMEASMSEAVEARLKNVISGSLCGVSINKTTMSTSLLNGAIRLKVHVDGTHNFKGHMGVDVVPVANKGRLFLRPKMNTFRIKFNTPQFQADNTPSCQKMAQLNGILDMVNVFSQGQFNAFIGESFKGVLLPPLDTTVQMATRDIVVEWVQVRQGALILGARPRQTPKQFINWAKLAEAQHNRVTALSNVQQQALFVNVHAETFNYALDRYVSRDAQTTQLASMVERASQSLNKPWSLKNCTVKATPRVMAKPTGAEIALPAMSCTLETTINRTTTRQTLWFGGRVPVKAMGSKITMDWQKLFIWSRCHDTAPPSRVVTCAPPFDDQALFQQGVSRAVPPVMELAWLGPVLAPKGISRIRGWHNQGTSRIDLELTVKNWDDFTRLIAGASSAK